MGARWPWTAWCAEGHEFSGYSGGSDGVCQVQKDDGTYCEAPVVKEQQDPWSDDVIMPPESPKYESPNPQQEELDHRQKLIIYLSNKIQMLEHALQESVENIEKHNNDGEFVTTKHQLAEWRRLLKEQ